MATFEEKILAYLDDSLSGAEREDVLAQISGGDARATRLFDAHVRLGSLYALAAKPVSAPLALQRELASKVPVLAMKLPYLAMPEDRRKRAAGWFWELPSFRMNAILILLAALLAGGIWLAVNSGRSGHVSQKNFARPSAIGGTASTGTASTGTASTGRASTGKVPNLSGNAPKNPSPQNGNTAGAVPSRISSLKVAHSGYHLQKTHPSDLSNRTYPTHSLKSESALLAHRIVTKEPIAVPPKEPASIPPPEVLQPELPLRTVDVSQPPTLFHAADAVPIPVIAGQEKSYTPVRVFVAENVRSLRLSTQPRPSDVAKQYGVWQSAITTESPELGIDYEITPWIAAGLRAGDARFVQELHVSHIVSKAGGYGHLTSSVTETALLDPFANWACAAATYTPNPGDRMEYSFTAAGGDIFLSGFSPTVLGEAAATYKFSDAVGLRASLSYQAAWVASANPVSVPSQNNSSVSGSSVTGSSVQSVTSKLFPSQSLGFSLGVSFHP